MQTLNKHEIILHLSLIEGVGTTAAWRLIQLLSKDEDYQNLYNLSSLEISFKFGLPPKVSNMLHKGLKDKSFLEKELQLIEKNKIKWTTLIDSDYPQILKHSYLPPLILYYKGQNIFNQKSLAVIGSRKVNNYGFKAIQTIVPQLVDNDWVIISGGAIGADTQAHEEALSANGKTIAILGSGLLRPYPISNIKLFNKIIQKGGSIISSFNLMMEPLARNFPARNRIIAGMSKGCLVIQAAQKSGTKITANFALEQGKEVFAIPGPIDDELSEGCHSLIKEGAKLVHNAQDILNEFGENEQLTIDDINSDRNLIDEDQAAPETDSLEDKIINLCVNACSIDELLSATDTDLQVLQAKLFELELDDKIKKDYAGMWQRI